MAIEVQCGGCARIFEVEDRFAGGIVNCPGCGRATEVSGLRDPIWWGLLALAFLGWAATSIGAGWAWGPLAGLSHAPFRHRDH